MITYKLAIPGQGTHVTLNGAPLVGLGIQAAARYLEIAHNAGRTDIAILPEQIREENPTVNSDDFKVAGHDAKAMGQNWRTWAEGALDASTYGFWQNGRPIEKISDEELRDRIEFELPRSQEQGEMMAAKRVRWGWPR